MGTRRQNIQMAASSQHSLTKDFSAAQLEAFSSNPKLVLAANAFHRTDPSTILTSLTSTRKDGNPHTYSHTVTDENKTANQKSSGRCWLFAYLNVVRRDIIKTHS